MILLTHVVDHENQESVLLRARILHLFVVLNFGLWTIRVLESLLVIKDGAIWFLVVGLVTCSNCVILGIVFFTFFVVKDNLFVEAFFFTAFEKLELILGRAVVRGRLVLHL